MSSRLLGMALAACLVLAAGPVLALRIVSLAPSVTETLFALGAGDEVVGVSTHCDYPAAVERIDRVGSFLTPNVEAIVAKRPDLVIVVPSPGNHAPVESLRNLGLKVLVTNPGSVAEVKESILTIGAAVGRGEPARALVAAIEERMARVRSRVEGAPRRRVLMVVGLTPLIAAGARTLQDELIGMAQGENIAAAAGEAWPQISIEFVLARAPEVILDTTMGNEERPGATGASAFWGAFPQLPAVRDARIHGFREYQLLRPGPRVAEALETIARFLHPERMNNDAR